MLRGWSNAAHAVVGACGLSAQEDLLSCSAAGSVDGLGWVACEGSFPQVVGSRTADRIRRLYLLLVMKVLLPYFREGVNIHYASYFAKFGQTPGEIVITMLTQPGRCSRSW